jgi:hypothetical protein
MPNEKVKFLFGKAKIGGSGDVFVIVAKALLRLVRKFNKGQVIRLVMVVLCKRIG